MEYDILLVKGNNWIARIIQKLTKSEYSHVALKLNNYHIVENKWFSKIKIKHIYFNNYDIYRVVGLTNNQKDKIDKFILQSLNSNYDYFRVFTMLFYILFKWKVINFSKLYSCDEFINLAFLNANVDLLPEIDIDKTAPGMFSESNLLTKI